MQDLSNNEFLVNSENSPIVFPDVKQSNTSGNGKTDKFLYPENAEYKLRSFLGPCELFQPERVFICKHVECTDFTDCFKNVKSEENYHLLYFYANDRMIWCKHIFPDILNFFAENNTLPGSDYLISFNHRYVFPNGKVSQFLHKGKIEFNEEKKLPQLSLRIFTELGEMKTDDSIHVTISSFTEESGLRDVFSQTYFPINNTFLSSRELEIIRFCEKGFTSKMIAEKLKLSIHTVKNHKRNSMAKTSTHNITQLIHYCIRNNWL